ncbi:MAG TPA: YciI family protein [Anditalea sp.]|nr:YciI family protein [Anditalea sp.]
MKSFLILILFLTCTNLMGQQTYDPALAEKLKADEYGMKTYIIAFLKRGPEVDKYSSEERSEIQQNHMANIQRLATSGKLILAGPFIEDQEFRGIFLFDVPTLEEAEALTATDPAVQAGVLSMDLKKWYGSAALTSIPEVHAKIQKTSF